MIEQSGIESVLVATLNKVCKVQHTVSQFFMALVTISGFPCCGKTRRAEQIRAALDGFLKDENYQGSISKVVVLSDDALNLNRSSYNGDYARECRVAEILNEWLSDSRSEKPARGTLFTAVQRHMALDTILIVDGLNYIKGFRYQMYCAAREMKLRVCTVRFDFGLSSDSDLGMCDRFT